MLAQVWVGRFGYSDLKEAAFSGAAALWELDGFSSSDGLIVGALGVDGPLAKRSRVSPRRSVGALDGLAGASAGVLGRYGAARVGSLMRGLGSRLELGVHAAPLCCCGGERGSS